MPFWKKKWSSSSRKKNASSPKETPPETATTTTSATTSSAVPQQDPSPVVTERTNPEIATTPNSASATQTDPLVPITLSSSPASLNQTTTYRPPAQDDILYQHLTTLTEVSPLNSTNLPSPTLGQQRFSQALLTALIPLRHGALHLKLVDGTNQIVEPFPAFWGRTNFEALSLDQPSSPAPHPSWEQYKWHPQSRPTVSFLESDHEMIAGYDGFHLGTLSIRGYVYEYRRQMMLENPQPSQKVEFTGSSPPTSLAPVVRKVQLLQGDMNIESDDTVLDKIISLGRTIKAVSSAATLQLSPPSNLTDFLAAGYYAAHFIGKTDLTHTHFLYHIQLGLELDRQLRRLGSHPAYSGHIQATPSACALIIIAQLWTENVSVQLTGIGDKCALELKHFGPRIEGLIQFAESIDWPYIDEAKRHIVGLLDEVRSPTGAMHPYLWDWLFGLVLPGKPFRHRILSCLIIACPSTRRLGAVPSYGDGLVLGGKSYWPKSTVLGRVLAGLKDAKSTCGWVGPLPAPDGCDNTWIAVFAPSVDLVPPVQDDSIATFVEDIQLTEAELLEGPEDQWREIADRTNWTSPGTLPVRSPCKGDYALGINLKAIRLGKLQIPGATQVLYGAGLEFNCYGQTVTFILNSNPVFVHVPKCLGTTHPIHRHLTDKLFKGIVPARDLNNGATIPNGDALIIIDATEPNEEAMARAWCAENRRHAVVRKNGIGCFACATRMAVRKTGLGFNVLIWCK